MRRVTGPQWCCADRFAWSCPVCFYRPPPRRRVFFLERTLRTKVEGNFGSSVRKLYRWTRPCFSGVTPHASNWLASGLPLHALNGTPRFRIKPRTQRHPNPTLKWTHGCPHHGPIQLPNLSRFRLVFRAPKSPKFGGKNARSAASTGWRSGYFWNPSGSDQRDPNTLAPNRIKARTTPSRPSRISMSS